VAALKLAATGVKDLFLLNRTASKAEAIANEISHRFPAVNVEVGYPNSEIDLVINATSLGLKKDDPMPLDLETFPLGKTRAVYDMIYHPSQTPLLTAAQEMGCKYANGLGMLLYQGTKALEIWSGQTAPVGAMREALRKEIYDG
jgi:shikimate dehydrogenase